MLQQLISEYQKPIVLDADALNILSEYKDWLNLVPQNSIFTPHPGEFKRMVGEWKSDYERLQIQIQLSKKYQIIVVLKGKNTSITLPSGLVYFNSTGNSGMATAGSGDVLTGILTSFLAQGYKPENAALLGVYLHGLAGDLAKKTLGEESLIASDIIDFLHLGFKQLKD
jgi:NAD(P)H-hydrate epimerase